MSERIREIQCLVIRKQIRFPHSRRKRIRKKWAKNRSNYLCSPDPKIYHVTMPTEFGGNEMLVGHPKTVKIMMQLLDPSKNRCRSTDPAATKAYTRRKLDLKTP